MKELECEIILDNTKRETNIQGSKELPVAIYNDYLKLNPVPYHWHEELELIVVIKGELKLIIELQHYILKEGDGMFINTGRLHSCEAFNNTDCIIKSFVFHASFIYGEQKSILYQGYFHALLQEASQNTLLLQGNNCILLLEAYNEFVKKDFAYEFAVREKLSSVLLSIIQSSENKPVSNDAKQLRALKRCKKMMSFIHENYKNDITLLDIASYAHVKESEALRCFKTVLNSSPIKYLKKHRIEQAAILLKVSSLAIIDIGFGCGFSEMSYFSKSFKEVYGLTPSEYRKT